MENNALCADDNGKFCPEFRAVKNDEILFFHSHAKLKRRNGQRISTMAGQRWSNDGVALKGAPAAIRPPSLCAETKKKNSSTVTPDRALFRLDYVCEPRSRSKHARRAIT